MPVAGSTLGGSATGGGAGVGGSADIAAGGRSDGGAGGQSSGDAGAAGEAGEGPLGVKEVVAGSSHTCVLLSDGTAKCWGDGVMGDLGTGTQDQIGDDELPSSVPAFEVSEEPRVTIRQIANGYYFTCAVLSDGSVKCWGYDTYDQLGYGNAHGYVRKPALFDTVSVTTAPGVTVQKLGLGWYHVCALLTDGSVTCWGQNSQGELGYTDVRAAGHATMPPSAIGPVDISSIPGVTVTDLAVGGGHTCVVLSHGNLKCWGYGGGLGYNTISMVGRYNEPADMEEVSVTSEAGVTVKQLVAGGSHTCALLSNGDVKCWGAAQNGALGYGTTDPVGAPSSVGAVSVTTKPGVTTTQLAAGSAHTCALLSDGTVTCWGNGAYGVLGYGNTEMIGDDELPSSVGAVSVTTTPGVHVVQLAAGLLHTCALLSDGSVKCWGDGSSGALGYGNTENIGDDELPSSVGPVSVF